MEKRPRPDGFDYNEPDPKGIRCPVCNQSGMNRTGLELVGYYSTSTMVGYASPCSSGCNYGLQLNIPHKKKVK